MILLPSSPFPIALLCAVGVAGFLVGFYLYTLARYLARFIAKRRLQFEKEKQVSDFLRDAMTGLIRKGVPPDTLLSGVAITYLSLHTTFVDPKGEGKEVSLFLERESKVTKLREVWKLTIERESSHESN